MQNMVYHAVETSHVYENTGVNVREWTGRSNIFDKSSRWSSWKACGGRLAMVCRCSLSLPFPRTEGGRGKNQSVHGERKIGFFLSFCAQGGSQKEVVRDWKRAVRWYRACRLKIIVGRRSWLLLRSGKIGERSPVFKFMPSSVG